MTTRLKTSPVFFIKNLFSIGGWKVRLHKFVAPDRAGCFHSHPAWAIRIVLWGGYVEEIPDKSFVPISGDNCVVCHSRNRRVGYIGVIRPEFVHRIHSLNNGKSSWSLWIRGPITHKVDANCEH